MNLSQPVNEPDDNLQNVAESANYKQEAHAGDASTRDIIIGSILSFLLAVAVLVVVYLLLSQKFGFTWQIF